MSEQVSLVFALIFVGVAVIFFLNRKLSDLAEKQKPSEELLEIIKMLQADSKENRKILLDSLQTNTRSLNERLDNAARVIGQVQKNIGEMSEIGRGMKDLQEFLRSPKLRGNIGEQVLKELLGQMLPKQSFNLQYTFKSGAIVDAAIKTASGIIPVDSKFAMENFRRMNAAQTEVEKKAAEKDFIKDVKNHIDSISAKYILTEEGTIDYALMYLPSESVYYEVVNNAELFDYAGKKRVLPVSPMTFYAYLRTILMSFEGQKIEARARQILLAIRAIQKDYTKVEDNLSVLGRHVQNAYNQMSNVLSSFTLLGQKLTSTQSLGTEVKEEAKELEAGESVS
ncbi:DNA recombination protein RmuC [Candidatus Shapirobacteria bacterium]|nr:DNA recombination protein RmuC [Candidatus Shapirobacteria bacterium]